MAIVTPIPPINFENTSYFEEDVNLIPSFETYVPFTTQSYVEFSIYNLNNELLYHDSNYTQYKVFDNGQSSLINEVDDLTITPEDDLTLLGFNEGIYEVEYNFHNPEVGSEDTPLYISEISTDRTELRLSSLDNIEEFINQTQNFIQKREESNYYFDFYINFGNNDLYIANNIAINEDSILIKLYSPLPSPQDNLYDVKSEVWVLSKTSTPTAYQVEFEEAPIIINDSTQIQGPNFNIEIKDQINNSSLEVSYNDLINTSLTSSKNQLNTLLNKKEIQINVDYTDFSNFIHFSSAKTRLENFYYKMDLMEQYSSSIALIDSNITGSTSSSSAVNESRTIYQNKIDNIIQNFDGYEYYLYYESGSYTWPKTNSTPPYQNATTGSTAVLNWFGSINENSPLYGGIILSSSFHDRDNKDNLLFSIPEYLRDDPDNQPYELFVNMVGQHYDNIWIYIKDVTNKFNADNRLNYGISKDLVADTIRDFGVKLYQNNFSTDELFTAFLGLTPNGSLFPFPNITGSLPTPTGFEYIDTLISASNDVIPLDDVNKSLYKRLYHNIPYLLKTKGTKTGLRALITSYGIPDTILRISEFGGKDKVNVNDWDYWQNKFNYAFNTEGLNYVYSNWTLNSTWNASNNRPSALEFRFKPSSLPTSSLNQTIWNLGGTTSDDPFKLTLQYTGSGLASGSYSGSITDPYYQYANLTLYPSSSNTSLTASVYLPFFDGGWWSVLINSSSNGFELYSKNKIYTGNDGSEIGFQASSSITSSYDGWSQGLISTFNGIFADTYTGSYQEIRYYKNSLSESVFDDYVMNPLSFEGNSINSSPNELVFRASLGSELDIPSISPVESLHPKVTGSWATTHSFVLNSDYEYDSTPTYISNTEYIFLDQPAVGIKNRISEKIRLENDVLPEGNTLSPFRRLSQTTEASASYTPNINYLEVAFSPQNEINDDIIGQLGYFNIGDYIGDPSFRTSSLTSYPDLDKLRDAYFEKYLSNYNVYDFVRLIKYFDNSLFKMIKDFVPARTSLATGVVIKQHLLERNRYQQPNITHENLEYSGTLKPQWNDFEEGRVSNFSGETGGSLSTFNGVNFSPYGPNGTGPENIFNITQSWSITTQYLSGSITSTQSTQDEFYNGEFSGSTLVVTTQDLNSGCDPFKKVNPTGADYGIRMYSGSEYTFGSFIDNDNRPTDGYISIWYQKDSISPIPPPPPNS